MHDRVRNAGPRSSHALDPLDVEWQRMTMGVERLCAWTGPLFLVIFFAAFIGLADMWPPRPPSWSAEQIKAFYLEDVLTKRLGIAICLFAWTLMVPWTVVLAAQTARIERGFRIFSIMQLAGGISTMAMGEIMLLFWGINTFRPAEWPAETMRMLNDLGWFIFVMYWAPGVLWCWSVAAPILLDRSPEPTFPRWVAYFNLWVGLCYFPASLGLFFKEGPMAYNGIITVWIPAGVFFAWYGVMTYVILSGIAVRKRRLSAIQS